MTVSLSLSKTGCKTEFMLRQAQHDKRFHTISLSFWMTCLLKEDPVSLSLSKTCCETEFMLRQAQHDKR